jgi:hypothetical protein
VKAKGCGRKSSLLSLCPKSTSPFTRHFRLLQGHRDRLPTSITMSLLLIVAKDQGSCRSVLSGTRGFHGTAPLLMVPEEPPSTAVLYGVVRPHACFFGICGSNSLCNSFHRGVTLMASFLQLPWSAHVGKDSILRRCSALHFLLLRRVRSFGFENEL